MASRKLALGLDPGFENLGASVLDIRTNRVLAMRLLHTSKVKLSLTQEDNLRRLRLIVDALDALFLEFPEICVMCSETLSYPRNAAVIAKQSMQWGSLVTIAHMRKLVFLHVQPKALKEGATGSKAASKISVRESLSRLFYPQDLGILNSSVARGDSNHIYDSLGAIVGCQNSAEYSLLKESCL